MKTLFKIFRITVLLALFIFIAFYTKTQKLTSTSWSETLQVIVYPMEGDNSPEVEQYINQLNSRVFNEIDQFLKEEAEHYSLALGQPTQTLLGEEILNHPPTAPNIRSSVLEMMWWSLKLRYWAFNNNQDEGSNFRRIRMYVYYHKAEKNKQLQHSLGMDKGLLVITHTFAHEEMEQQNNIVLAHELLHTLGASDKYDQNNQPVFPNGYAEPDNTPLFPQTLAEIMSAKIPSSPTESEMAENLNQCVVGTKTAQEINWIEQPSENIE